MSESSKMTEGVRYLEEGGAERTRFTVYAEADVVRVRLAHPGTREVIVSELEGAGRADADGGRLWNTEIAGDFHGWSYCYEIERDGKQLGEIVDPWAVLIRHGRGWVWRDETPVEPRPAMRPEEAVIYELHIRDYTRDASSGVSPRHRGKYLGLTERGTRLAGTEVRTGLDNILELGATVVQVMPVHAFSMPYDPDYEWGYMPNDYNAPHDRYASATDLGAPIREFKEMVSALHKAGLRVTLDVVYNHDAERWPSKLRSLMALAPRAYFRFQKDGTPWDGSACGNEFRSDSEAGRRFLVESVKYWVREYGIDGYRFDLMGLIDQESMRILTRELHAMDPTILVYGEPWAGGPCGIEVNGKGKQRGLGWGVFNDDIRDGLRGRVFDLDDHGMLTRGIRLKDVKDGIVGGIRTFTDGPLECLNYAECHDNHTLTDRLQLMAKRMSDGGLDQEQIVRLSKLAILTLATSQGILFIHSGQEFGRSKAGEDNTYNLGDVVNNIRWTDKRDHSDLFAFHRNCITMRRAHPMFRLTTRKDIEQSIRFLDDDLKIKLPERSVGFMLEDATGHDDWSCAVVLLNADKDTRNFELPEGLHGLMWHIEVLDGRFVRDGATAEKSIRLSGRSGAVLWQRR